MFKKSQNIFLVIFLIVASSLIPLRVLAYDADFYSANDILFYDDRDSNCYSANNSTVADGKNIETVLRFFIEQKGLSLEAAAGIAGNLMLESGYNINPSAENEIGAYGIAQWLGGRRTKLENFAKENNTPIDDLTTQMEFLWHELESGYQESILKPFSETITPEEAAGLFNDKFERAGESPGDPIYVKRQTYAVEAYNLAVSLGLISQTVAASSTTRCGDGNTAGQDGWDLEGEHAMTFYDQSGTEWKDKPFGIGTIGACGCGPTSLASIVATLTGDQSVNPENMAAFYASHGGQIGGGRCGSTWNWDVIEDDYGVNVESIGLDLDKAKETLKNGGLVLFSWEGAPFTANGHIVIMRKIGPEGTIYVANTGGRTNRAQSDIAWDEDIFINGYNGNDIPERGTTGSLNAMWSITKK